MRIVLVVRKTRFPGTTAAVIDAESRENTFAAPVELTRHALAPLRVIGGEPRQLAVAFCRSFETRNFRRAALTPASSDPELHGPLVADPWHKQITAGARRGTP